MSSDSDKLRSALEAAARGAMEGRASALHDAIVAAGYRPPEQKTPTAAEVLARQESVLREKAIYQGWYVPVEVRPAIVDEMVKVVRTSTDARAKCQAASNLLAMSKLTAALRKEDLEEERDPLLAEMRELQGRVSEIERSRELVRADGQPALAGGSAQDSSADRVAAVVCEDSDSTSAAVSGEPKT